MTKFRKPLGIVQNLSRLCLAALAGRYQDDTSLDEIVAEIYRLRDEQDYDDQS